MSKILFVIVSYNAKRYMQECIQSIREKITPGSYKIAVVDNASTDGIAEWLSDQSDILLIRNQYNIGFGPGCNQAVSATYGTEYADYDIFLLNNDTVMTKTAVPLMLEKLYSADDIGAVGCMSSYAGNRQEYPVEFSSTEEYIQYGESLNIPKADSTLERVRLNGFAMLIKRVIWDEIGGFDEDFAPGYYEDDALSIEILKRGYRLVLQRDSFIYHVGSASFVKTGTNKLSYEHHELFIKKYGFDILDYVYPCGAIMSQIPFSRDAAFSVLHLGCGLGSELKAIRSLYPCARLFAIETNPTLYDIVSKTELVFPDVASALKELSLHSINLLIVDSNYLPQLSEDDKSHLISLCAEHAVELNRLHVYDSYPFDAILMVVWEKELFSPVISQFLLERGVICIAEPDTYTNELICATGISNEHILRITQENAPIVPYLTAHFGRISPNTTKKSRAQVLEIFLKRFENSKLFSNRDEFNKDCGLQISFHDDCEAHINEIKTLIEESNLLLDEDAPTDSNRLERLFNNDWNCCEYITAADKYGDYGIVGFYCYNMRQQKMLLLALGWIANELGIKQSIYTRIKNNASSPHAKRSNKIRILIKGDSNLTSIENYLIGGNITSEYNDCREKNLCIEGDSLPSLMFTSKYHIIIYSLLQYDYASWESDGDGCLAKLFNTLDDLYDGAPGNPTVILLLGSEKYYDTSNTLSCKLAELNAEINPIVSDYAAAHDRIRVINVSEFIAGSDDFSGSINLFSVRVFSDLAEQVCLYINEKVDELLG